MRQFFHNHGILVLFLSAVLAVTLAVASVLFPNASPWENALNLAVSPVRTAAADVTGWFRNLQVYYRDVTALQEENEALRRRVAEMEEAVRRAESDSAENKRLRELLELRAQHKDLTDLETAMITEHSVTNWNATLTVDKGTIHGVAEGNCVIDTTGALAGVVTDAGTNWASIRTTLDAEISIGAQAFRTKELGVVRGDFVLMEQGRMCMEYLPAKSRLLPGDLIVTSGFGGYYPAGLVIGSVEEIRMDDAGSSSYAILKPAVNFNTLTQVAIVKSFDYVS